MGRGPLGWVSRWQVLGDLKAILDAAPVKAPAEAVQRHALPEEIREVDEG